MSPVQSAGYLRPSSVTCGLPTSERAEASTVARASAETGLAWVLACVVAGLPGLLFVGRAAVARGGVRFAGVALRSAVWALGVTGLESDSRGNAGGDAE